MIPGPSEPDPEVLAELSLPILPHYGPKWGELYQDTLARLQRVFRTSNEVILLPVPGQVAVEMAVLNLARDGDDVFVCANGFFSEMIVEMVKLRGANPVVIRNDHGRAITGKQVRAFLENRKGVEGRPLFVVHNETSTGVLNPVREILAACADRGVISVLDAISSFGGIDVRVDDWRADFCIGYPSKAVGGIFGVTPVSISKSCWDAARRNAERIPSRFLNLNTWRKHIDEWGAWGHPHPTTMPTSVVAALHRALEMIEEEGLENRLNRHKVAGKKMREGLEALGLELFPEKEYYSDTVSAAKVDPKLDSSLRTELLDSYGIMIAGGLGELRGKIIRVGHMGTSANEAPIRLTLEAMRAIMTKSPAATPKSVIARS